MQETKLPSLDKLTKDLACVDDYESFWAVSREKKGYSGKAFCHAAKDRAQMTALQYQMFSSQEDISWLAHDTGPLACCRNC